MCQTNYINMNTKQNRMLIGSFGNIYMLSYACTQTLLMLDATRWTLPSVMLEMHGFYHHIQNGPIFENNAITTEFW